MESFFHFLKTELVHHRDYNIRAEAQRDIFAFIEGFYNRTCSIPPSGYRPGRDGVDLPYASSFHLMEQPRDGF